MTDNPAAREMLGYLFVRGGVHALAYARALETLTGVEMSKMLPIPKQENEVLPEAKKVEEMGMHRKRNRFSPDDYRSVTALWHGPAPDGSGESEVGSGTRNDSDRADPAHIGD